MLLCLLAAFVIILAAIALAFGRSPNLTADLKLLRGQSTGPAGSVLVSATNQSSDDYFFSCELEIQTKSGWSEVSHSDSDDLHTVRYFSKGEVVQLRLGLPQTKGVYRFHCFYSPTTWTWLGRMYNRLCAFKLPGKLGTWYQQVFWRLQPWPRSFYSKVFENAGSDKPDPSSQ